MDRIHTGLPVYISEYDVNLGDDSEQFPAFLETDHIPGITSRGWITGSTWVTYGGLVNLSDGSFRPAMT
ncbi:MAG: hypothetical protein JW940_01520 [Polyangiaceae bacterium]|nr:hypothetical protein [Polyangiaceae bacterium]